MPLVTGVSKFNVNGPPAREKDQGSSGQAFDLADAETSHQKHQQEMADLRSSIDDVNEEASAKEYLKQLNRYETLLAEQTALLRNFQRAKTSGFEQTLSDADKTRFNQLGTKLNASVQGDDDGVSDHLHNLGRGRFLAQITRQNNSISKTAYHYLGKQTNNVRTYKLNANKFDPNSADGRLNTPNRQRNSNGKRLRDLDLVFRDNWIVIGNKSRKDPTQKDGNQTPPPGQEPTQPQQPQQPQNPGGSPSQPTPQSPTPTPATPTPSSQPTPSPTQPSSQPTSKPTTPTPTVTPSSIPTQPQSPPASSSNPTTQPSPSSAQPSSQPTTTPSQPTPSQPTPSQPTPSAPNTASPPAEDNSATKLDPEVQKRIDDEIKKHVGLVEYADGLKELSQTNEFRHKVKQQQLQSIDDYNAKWEKNHEDNPNTVGADARQAAKTWIDDVTRTGKAYQAALASKDQQQITSTHTAYTNAILAEMQHSYGKQNINDFVANTMAVQTSTQQLFKNHPDTSFDPNFADSIKGAIIIKQAESLGNPAPEKKPNVAVRFWHWLTEDSARDIKHEVGQPFRDEDLASISPAFPRLQQISGGINGADDTNGQVAAFIVQAPSVQQDIATLVKDFGDRTPEEKNAVITTLGKNSPVVAQQVTQGLMGDSQNPDPKSLLGEIKNTSVNGHKDSLTSTTFLTQLSNIVGTVRSAPGGDATVTQIQNALNARFENDADVNKRLNGLSADELAPLISKTSEISPHLASVIAQKNSTGILDYIKNAKPADKDSATYYSTVGSIVTALQKAPEAQQTLQQFETELSTRMRQNTAPSIARVNELNFDNTTLSADFLNLTVKNLSSGSQQNVDLSKQLKSELWDAGVRDTNVGASPTQSATGASTNSSAPPAALIKTTEDAYKAYVGVTTNKKTGDELYVPVTTWHTAVYNELQAVSKQVEQNPQNKNLSAQQIRDTARDLISSQYHPDIPQDEMIKAITIASVIGDAQSAQTAASSKRDGLITFLKTLSNGTGQQSAAPQGLSIYAADESILTEVLQDTRVNQVFNDITSNTPTTSPLEALDYYAQMCDAAEVPEIATRIVKSAQPNIQNIIQQLPGSLLPTTDVRRVIQDLSTVASSVRAIGDADNMGDRDANPRIPAAKEASSLIDNLARSLQPLMKALYSGQLQRAPQPSASNPSQSSGNLRSLVEFTVGEGSDPSLLLRTAQLESDAAVKAEIYNGMAAGNQKFFATTLPGAIKANADASYELAAINAQYGAFVDKNDAASMQRYNKFLTNYLATHPDVHTSQERLSQLCESAAKIMSATSNYYDDLKTAGLAQKSTQAMEKFMSDDRYVQVLLDTPSFANYYSTLQAGVKNPFSALLADTVLKTLRLVIQRFGAVNAKSHAVKAMILAKANPTPQGTGVAIRELENFNPKIFGIEINEKTVGMDEDVKDMGVIVDPRNHVVAIKALGFYQGRANTFDALQDLINEKGSSLLNPGEFHNALQSRITQAEDRRDTLRRQYVDPDDPRIETDVELQKAETEVRTLTDLAFKMEEQPPGSRNWVRVPTTLEDVVHSNRTYIDSELTDAGRRRTERVALGESTDIADKRITYGNDELHFWGTMEAALANPGMNNDAKIRAISDAVRQGQTNVNQNLKDASLSTGRLPLTWYASTPRGMAVRMGAVITLVAGIAFAIGTTPDDLTSWVLTSVSVGATIPSVVTTGAMIYTMRKSGAAAKELKDSINAMRAPLQNSSGQALSVDAFKVTPSYQPLDYLGNETIENLIKGEYRSVADFMAKTRTSYTSLSPTQLTALRQAIDDTRPSFRKNVVRDQISQTNRRIRTPDLIIRNYAPALAQLRTSNPTLFDHIMYDYVEADVSTLWKENSRELRAAGVSQQALTKAVKATQPHYSEIANDADLIRMRQTTPANANHELARRAQSAQVEFEKWNRKTIQWDTWGDRFIAAFIAAGAVSTLHNAVEKNWALAAGDLSTTLASFFTFKGTQKWLGGGVSESGVHNSNLGFVFTAAAVAIYGTYIVHGQANAVSESNKIENSEAVKEMKATVLQWDPELITQTNNATKQGYSSGVVMQAGAIMMGRDLSNSNDLKVVNNYFALLTPEQKAEFIVKAQHILDSMDSQHQPTVEELTTPDKQQRLLRDLQAAKLPIPPMKFISAPSN